MSLKKILFYFKRERKIALCIALVFGMLFTTGFTNNRNVKIAVDGHIVEVNTRYTSPELILEQAGIKMHQKDEYHLEKTNSSEAITIYRAVPVTIEYQGKKQEIYTSKPTVGDVLSDLGYTGDAYQADLEVTTKIQENLNIKVTDLRQERETEREEQIEISRGAMRYTGELDMEASAYLPSDGGGSGITASGMMAQRGVVAVDPSVIPLGTRLYIPGYGMAVAADTGGAIVGDRIDLCMESYGEAMDFGRRTIKVYILE